jgi:membrane-associated protease RseP (regulator of RpoE activity)
MLKPFPMICLTAATIPVVGALLWAQSDKPPREAHSTPVSVAVAMQESRPAAPEGAQSKTNDAGWVGVMVEDNKGHGVRVEGVFPGGPAAFAGIRRGDVVLRVGSTEINSTQDAETAIEHLAPQHETAVTVERNHKAVELKVIPGSLTDFRHEYMAEMLRRDPRDPKFGAHHGVSPGDMQSELVRRLFEQNERLDRSMNELTKEVHALRKQVAALQK